MNFEDMDITEIVEAVLKLSGLSRVAKLMELCSDYTYDVDGECGAVVVTLAFESDVESIEDFDGREDED